jgi:hypothetical protein
MLDRVPLVGGLLRAGASDPVYDALLVAGPVVVAALAVLGRSLATTALATAYVLTFVGYTLAKGLADYRRQ